MNYSKAIAWCNKLNAGWRNVDFDQILEIFADVEYYYEDPFCQPVSTPEGIRELWEDIAYQEIKELSIYPIAVDGNTVIARWFLNYVDKRTKEIFVMDGIYQMEFNSHGKCVKFIQWWVMKE